MALSPSPDARRPGFRLALVAVGLAFIVVLLGAFTRLSDAGLGCPDWPGCYGHLTWPKSPEQVVTAEALFPQAPVEHDKTWPEMVHRYFASMLGLLIVALAVIAWRNRKCTGYPLRLPLLLLVLVIWQGLFGMWTVTLKLWPQVVTTHLLGGFSVLSLLWLLALRLADNRWQLVTWSLQRLQRLKPWLIGGIVVVFAQLALGGWTTSNYAAFACPDLPACQGQWLPPMDFAQGFNLTQAVGPNYLGGLLDSEARVAIHFSHRLGAVVTALYLIGLSIALLRIGDRQVGRMAAILLVALSAQIALGVSNVLFTVPMPVAVLHNAGGAMLLLVLVTLGMKSWTAQAIPSKAERTV
ncbi:MAG: COX15/CtaA family protein [Porticoccaceae bacterium]